MSIVKKCHQTWKTTDTSRFPADWSESWRELNPGWEYCFWTDDDIDAFIREEYPDFVDVWEEYDAPIKKPDSWRYLCLQRIGGLYVDMDFACLKSIDSLFENIGDKFAIAKEGDPNSPETYGNSFMACNPDAPLLEGIVDGFRKKRHLHVLESSACGFISKWINKGRREMVHHIDTQAIFPLWWNDHRKQHYNEVNVEQMRKDFPDSYAISLWTHTWKDNE